MPTMIALSGLQHRGLTAVLLFTAALTACDSQAHDGDDGGAVVSQAGAAARLAGGANGFELPSCVRDLWESCGATGACRQQLGEDGLVQAYCFDSGARAEYAVNATCTAVGRSELRVMKPDGALCLTFEVSNVIPGHACEHGDYTWRNAAGETVATGSFSSGMGTRRMITCSASGESVSCGPEDCPQRMPGDLECDVGDCTD